MNNDAVIFKGNKEGLFIILKEDMDFENIKSNLEKKVKPSKKFFDGARIVSFKGKALTFEEFEELKQIMQQDYGMNVIGNYKDSQASDNIEKEEQEESRTFEKLRYENVSQGQSLIVRATIRSGQLIEYKGNIVVIGDVNPGAELKAEGSIIIMGGMRGVAHAGTNGDYSTFIAAFNLQPTQLRIGDIITRSPDGSNRRNSIPEMAIVKQGMILVEPYR